MPDAAGVRLFSDLDRTLIPNGHQPESELARPLLRALVEEGALSLVYISGRHLALIDEAIEEYGLPRPQLVVGDVGASIYARGEAGWQRLEDWTAEIAPDWRDRRGEDLAALFTDLEHLALQEDFRQGPFKLSYYTPEGLDPTDVLAEMQRRLTDLGIRAELTFSIDDAKGVGLLDVLPSRASKLGALQFIATRAALPPERLVFAGDSGNDLAVLVSGVRAVLVRNARDDVRAEATRRLQGNTETLYLARGGFLGMNGNYAAGVLEGLAHFRPELRTTMEAAQRRLAGRGPDLVVDG